MTAISKPGSVQLHITVGPQVLLEFLNNWGVQSWNRWVVQMENHMPFHWGQDDPVPGVWYWLDITGVDLSGRNLDGLDLRLATCHGAIFDNSSLVGARFLSAENASFDGSDISHASFRLACISGSNFQRAKTEGTRFCQSFFTSTNPPIGLGEKIRFCQPCDDDDPAGPGATEYSVPLQSSLIPLWN